MLIFLFSFIQAQSDDDDVGPDDVNVAVEGGFMDEFFSEVRNPLFPHNQGVIHFNTL